MALVLAATACLMLRTCDAQGFCVVLEGVCVVHYTSFSFSLHTRAHTHTHTLSPSFPPSLPPSPPSLSPSWRQNLNVPSLRVTPCLTKSSQRGPSRRKFLHFASVLKSWKHKYSPEGARPAVAFTHTHIHTNTHPSPPKFLGSLYLQQS